MRSYRLDIDGLRAIAVLIVVGFHLKFDFFSGGHVGVDVFFVLSGLLITSILLEKISEGRFSAATFYAQRVQRLFPALFTTIFVSFIAASFILLPDDFAKLARSAVAAVFSLSNFLFWRESGYWDVTSDTKALLHTWSLGVEEQFYLVWPATVLLLVKARVRIVNAFATITVLGIFVCYFLSLQDISAAFFLLPARVFQFAAGGLLAAIIYTGSLGRFLEKNYVRNALFLSGLALLTAGTILLDRSTMYPGIFALIPTLAAFAILLAGSGAHGQGNLGALLLENPVFTWIGRVSYSLYLVHWPIIVLYRYKTGHRFDAIEVVGILVLIFISTAALHYGVERRFYARRFSSNKKGTTPARLFRQVAFTLSSGLLLAIFATHAWQYAGWSWRFPDLIYSINDIEAMKTRRLHAHSQACHIHQWPDQEYCQSTKTTRVLFFGNSHEPDGFNFMQAAYPEDFLSFDTINFGTINSCKNLRRKGSRWTSQDSSCQERLDALFRADFISDLDVIVYSSHDTFKYWSESGWGIISDVLAMNENIRVVTIGDYLETHTPCINSLNLNGSTEFCFLEENIYYDARGYQDQKLFPVYRNLVDLYINRVDLLCKNHHPYSCLSMTEDGFPYSVDNHHLSLEFAEMAGRIYARENPDLFATILAENFDNRLAFRVKNMGPDQILAIQSRLQEIYISILGRAADWQGLEYWLLPIIEGARTLEYVRAEFTNSDQKEYFEAYGNLSHSDYVKAAFENILGRSPDQPGLDYWVEELASGRVNQNQMISALINAVKSPKSNEPEASRDLAVLKNKIEAANYFTQKTRHLPYSDELRDTARAVVRHINSEPASVDYSNSLTRQFLAGQSASVTNP